MDLEIVDDSKKKDSVIIKESKFKLENFEILMSLGKGSFGSVFKVRSKLNNKIYVMKVIDLNLIQEKDPSGNSLRRTLNESNFLLSLSFPHIIKYYQNFQENGFLYIILEYVPNGDLQKLIKMKSILKEKFEEEEIWNIFLQCIFALNYIHQKGIIHRDIKPLNIFIDNDLKIKFGDFGCAALDPNKVIDNKITYINKSFLLDDENTDKIMCHFSMVGTDAYMPKEVREKNKYDQKVDVYSLGNTFYEIVYQHSPLFNIPEDEKVSYPNLKEILNIINEMRADDNNKRKTSEEIYKLIEKEYLNICRNFSIHSILMCLSAFDDLNKKLINERQNYINKNNKNNKNIIKSYTDFMIFLYNKNSNLNDETIKNKVNDFRKILGLENLKLEGTKEIKLSFLFSFIILKLHEETKIQINDINRDYETGPFLINSITEEEKNNENDAKKKFDNLFMKFDSLIIQNFRGLIKCTNICNKCNNKTYTFNSYFLVNFNLNKIIEKQNIININIQDLLTIKDIYINKMYCNNCIEKTEHNCEKEYYSFPTLLVINFDRGNKSINKMEINVKEYLEIRVLENQKKYRLVGLIKIIKENEKDRYISNFYNYKEKRWFTSERNKKINPIHPPFNNEEKKNYGSIDGDIVMLYYISI